MPSTASKSSLGVESVTTINENFVRCPAETLTRLRRLHEAEIITLFSPLVPHSPNTSLARDMDPFEPLGRALPRRVRHVPYRLDYGMTETHADFLPTSGAVLVVVCITEHILSRNAQASEQQVRFARAVLEEMENNGSMMEAPIVLLLVDDQVTAQKYGTAMQDFPALATINDYTTTTYKTVVEVLFGR